MAAEFAFNVYAISQSSLTLSACDEMCSVQLYGQILFMAWLRQVGCFRVSKNQ